MNALPVRKVRTKPKQRLNRPVFDGIRDGGKGLFPALQRLQNAPACGAMAPGFTPGAQVLALQHLDKSTVARQTAPAAAI